MPTPRPAGFDSASAAAAAVAAALRGAELPPLGKSWAATARPAVLALNRLPESGRRVVYERFTGSEGQRPGVVERARWANLSQHAVDGYPRRRYPAVVIGSTPGPVVYLCALLGVPLLPQTQLLPLRRRLTDIDDVDAELELVPPVGRRLVTQEPDLVLHHMIDPNEDRLTLRRFAYLRVKATRLGATYEQFLADTLQPGGTIIVSDCQATWPVTALADRYLFQFGGVGGATLDDYFRGGARVATFLARHGATRRRWDPPAPTGEAPEAEWGFEPRLESDIREFAGRHGFRVVALRYPAADSASPLVAELFRWWYAASGAPSSRLHVGSFVLVAPHAVLATRTVPGWATFSDAPSVARVADYLATHPPYDEVQLALMAHGTRSLGVSGPGDWARVLRLARRHGELAGVDPARFPADFSSYLRFRDRLACLPRDPDPPRPALAEVAAFLRDHAAGYGVEFG